MNKEKQRYRDNRFIYILISVDDLTVYYESEEGYSEIIKHLSEEVELKEGCNVNYYSGVQIEKEETVTNPFEIIL